MLGQYTDPLCSHASGKEVPKATKVMAVISGPMFLAMAVCTPPTLLKSLLETGSNSCDLRVSQTMQVSDSVQPTRLARSPTTAVNTAW